MSASLLIILDDPFAPTAQMPEARPYCGHKFFICFAATIEIHWLLIVIDFDSVEHGDWLRRERKGLASRFCAYGRMSKKGSSSYIIDTILHKLQNKQVLTA